MKKIFYAIILVLIAGFLGIQLIQPEKNNLPVTKDDLFNQLETPFEIQELIKNSCYDCHSNQTKYPWYNNIAPVSWMIADHVKEGKEHLNFSEWGHLKKRKKIGALNDICEVCEEMEMPLPSYTLIHKNAKLSQSDIEIICNWTKEASSAILRKK